MLKLEAGFRKLCVASVQDPDLNVRYATVSQLAVAGQADPPKALELMRHLIEKETDGSVRAAVADGMCAMGIPEVRLSTIADASFRSPALPTALSWES